MLGIYEPQNQTTQRNVVPPIICSKSRLRLCMSQRDRSWRHLYTGCIHPFTGTPREREGEEGGKGKRETGKRLVRGVRNPSDWANPRQRTGRRFFSVCYPVKMGAVGWETREAREGIQSAGFPLVLEKENINWGRVLCLEEGAFS